MKGLNIEDNDSLKENLTQSSYQSEILTCPSYKRSLISSKNIKQNKSNKSLKINIISHLSNINSSKLSVSSPVIKKNLSSKDNNNKYDFKYSLFKLPEIKEFNLYYEIPFHGKYDFIFLLRGSMKKNEWTMKTKNIRKYPTHLKNTLFYQNDIKLQQIHTLNFNRIYNIYKKIKSSGLNLYNNKKFRECLEQFNYAYGLFKWIELKDKTIPFNEKINNENFVILDSDIEEKSMILDNNDYDNNNQQMIETKKVCLIYILEIMAYCNIELRLFSNAIECLEECAILAQKNYPDVYLRRAQARLYNKKSSDQELKLAEEDINQAINIVLHNNKNKIDLNIYYKTRYKLNQIIQKRSEMEIKYIRTILKPNLNLRNNSTDKINNDNVLYIKPDNNKTQYKILKEIKKKYILAFKFFTETKNYTQLDLTYKEYEIFYNIFSKFKFFYKFSPNNINETISKQLNEKEKKILFDLNNQAFIDKNRKNICDYIFIRGNYNKVLYKYAIDKISKEEKIFDEKEEKINEIKNEVNDSSGKGLIVKSSLYFIVLILVSVLLQIFYLKSIRKSGFKPIYK